MPAFLTHWRIFEIAAGMTKGDASIQAALTAPKPTYRGWSQWAYLGAMGPDIPYFGPSAFSWLADGFHDKKPNSYVADFLEHVTRPQAKQTGSNPGDSAVGYTFILGFLCHMAGDLMLHPYVNSFAGVSGDKSIGVAATAYVLCMKETARTHRYIELMFDVYLAKKYFGAPKLSDGPGNRFTASWSDFVGDVSDTSETKRLLQNMITVGNKTYPYGKKHGTMTLEDARKAMKSMVQTALDIGYDAAMLYVPDTAHRAFVQHKWRDRNFEDYLDAAARICVTFWQAAARYYAICVKTSGSPPRQARREFLKAVPNFSIDTGYVPRVYSDSGSIHIRYDHCWALFLRETGAQVVDMEFDDLDATGKLPRSPHGVSR